MTPDPSLAPVAAQRSQPAAAGAILVTELPPVPGPLRDAIARAWVRDEAESIVENCGGNAWRILLRCAKVFSGK